MAVSGDPQVLVVAGSDSSGGAGIVRDVETLAAFGVKGCVAVTAVTVQTHRTGLAVRPVAPDLIADQISAAMAANPVGAVKIGLLPDAASVEAVARALSGAPAMPVVLDPVIIATSGQPLASDDTAGAILARLPWPTVLITPNRAELARLTACTLLESDEAAARSEALLALGFGGVLAKGGHAATPSCDDILIRTGEPVMRFAGPRLPGTVRGTGCMLSSAIAAGLAAGNPIESAVDAARRYVLGRFACEAGSGNRR